MRTITVAVIGGLRDETVAGLSTNWGDIDIRFVETNDEFGYSRILQEYWEKGEDFAVVEPDIVIRPDVADAFRNCQCEYGCFPYAWLTDIGPALGCTWFRSSFLHKYPTAMKEVIEKNVSWRQLDVILMRHILARKYGEQPHVHLPPVEHLNENKKLLPEASLTPLMEVPHW